MNTIEIPTEAYVDGSGPVFEAIETLVLNSNLVRDVTLVPRSPGDSVIKVTHNELARAGGGSQALWEILLSIAHGRPVSLHWAVGRLDDHNRRAVAAAMAAFCR